MIIIKDNLIVIKDYKEMKILSSKLIIVNIKERSYKIKGDNLVMNYYDRYEIRISGDVKVILYGV